MDINRLNGSNNTNQGMGTGYNNVTYSVSIPVVLDQVTIGEGEMVSMPVKGNFKGGIPGNFMLSSQEIFDCKTGCTEISGYASPSEIAPKGHLSASWVYDKK
jgi:hypothetical protein